MMKSLLKIFFIASLCFLTTQISSGQVRADSIIVKQGGSQSSPGKGMNNGNAYGQRSANSQNSQGQKGIKQVRGARPDMSKARGARPPEITRPSGSGIPRGMGKPGGAGKRGGR